MARVAGLLLAGSGRRRSAHTGSVSQDGRLLSTAARAPRADDLDLPRPAVVSSRQGSRKIGRRSSAAARRRKAMARVLVLVATRKGAWLYRGDAARRAWRVDGPHFLGHVLNHLVLDPRDRRTLLAAAKTGHLGPTVFRSTDFGRTWKEAAPAARVPEGRRPRGRPHVLADPRPRVGAGHLVRRDVAAGPLPLRRRRRHLGAASRPSTTTRSTAKWMGTVQDGTPDGPEAPLDPRRPARPRAPLFRACRAAASTSRATAGRPGRRSSRGWRSSRASTRPT